VGALAAPFGCDLSVAFVGHVVWTYFLSRYAVVFFHNQVGNDKVLFLIGNASNIILQV
jgi:hypothetical protein